MNIYLVYEIDNWQANPNSNFTIKNNCLVLLNQQETQSKEMVFGMCLFGIVFDGAASWNFGNMFARNAVISGVHNSSSIHSEYLNIFFIRIFFR